MNTSKLRTLALSLALAASTVGAGLYAHTALAQVPPAAGEAARPAPTPARTAGTIAHYLVGPMGHVRGFVLNNNAIVMLRGPGGDELATRAPVGTHVNVEGFSLPRNAEVIMHATVTNAAGNVLLAAPQRGEHGEHGERGHRGFDRGEFAQRRAEHMAQMEAMPMMNATGVVQAVLGGHRGPHALLLTDGTMVYLPRFDETLAARGVRVGETVRASGHGQTYPQGTAVVAGQLTFSDGATFTAAAPGAAVR